MLDASVAEFVGYTCSGMAGCISLDSQSPAVTIVPGFRLSSSLVHVLVASRMHGKQHLQHLARVGRFFFSYQPQTEADVYYVAVPKRLCVVFGRGRSWRVVGVSCVPCGKVRMKRSCCA